MKTIFKILLVISFLTGFAQYTKAEDTLNPCWDMFYPHRPDKGYFNPDSVLYDTCQCPGMKKFDCTYIYARQWYEIEFFNEDPYNLPEYPHDTIIKKTWQEIDSSYVELRNMFQNIESIFGTFILRKKFPEEVNPNKPSSRVYLIKFQNYCKIDSVVNYINSSGLVIDFYYKFAAYHDDTYVVDDLYNYRFEIKLFPNPCNENIEINIKYNYTTTIDISITDIYGNINQYQKIMIQNPDEFTFKFNTSNFSTGIYLIKINNGKQFFYEKFIVMR